MPIPENTREIPLTQGQVAIVDAADYEWLSQYTWSLLRSKHTCYAFRRTTRAKGAKPICIFMHREILGVDDGSNVDHCDGEGLHNWRANLRQATQSQNMANTRLRSDNRHGFKGIERNGDCKKWAARLKANGTVYYSGGHPTAEDAARIYDALASEHCGEFARLNFPRP